MLELHTGTFTFVEISFKVEINLLVIKFTVRFLLYWPGGKRIELLYGHQKGKKDSMIGLDLFKIYLCEE